MDNYLFGEKFLEFRNIKLVVMKQIDKTYKKALTANWRFGASGGGSAAENAVGI